jgi:O-antigen ligase
LEAVDVLVLAAVVALPWCWGGVDLEFYRSAAAVIALAAGWALMRDGAAGLGLGRRGVWLLPAFLLGAWAFAQTVPVPRAWVSSLSPNAAMLQTEMLGPEGLDGAGWLRQIETDARARVPEAEGAVVGGAGAFTLGGAAPKPSRDFTLSLLPSDTRESAFWYAALLLAFLVVHHRTANSARAAAYRATLLVSCGVLAIVGSLNRVTAPTRLLWMRDVAPGVHPMGPYVNPSHFGGAMELMAPWLLGYGLAATMHADGAGGRRPGGVLALAGAGVAAVAAVLAASKMAVVTIGLSYGVLITVAMISSRGRKRRVLIAGTAAAALLIGMIAVVGPLRERIEDFAASHSGSTSQSLRGLAWTAALRMADDYRWTGTGFDASGDLLPAYLPRGEAGDWSELHNDYLEIYVAGGVVAVFLVAWLTAAFVWRVIGVARSSAARGRLLPTLGLILGLVAMAVHESVDFNLQVPANALLFVVLAAMSVSPLARFSEES